MKYKDQRKILKASEQTLGLKLKQEEYKMSRVLIHYISHGPDMYI